MQRSPIEKVQPKALHSRRTIVTERTRLDHIVLTHVLVLKVSAHRDLSLETSVAYRAMVWQCFRVRRKVFRKVVLSKESLLAYPTFVRLHPRMPHLQDTTMRCISMPHSFSPGLTLCRLILAPLENFILQTSHSNIFL